LTSIYNSGPIVVPNIKVTLGILVEAKRKGLIESFTDLSKKLKEHGIFFSEQLIAEISKSLGE